MKSKQFIVLGMGRFGTSIAKSLVELGQEVLVVDKNEELVENISDYVTQAVQMDATDERALASLGITNFDTAIVSIGSNMRESILICMLLKEMGVKFLYAKANDELHAKVLRKIGVDRVIFPEKDMGARVARILMNPNALDLMSLSDDYQIIETRLPRKWGGNTIIDLNVRRKFGVSILAIYRNDRYIPSPGAETHFEAGDRLLVMGKKTDIDNLDN